MRYLVLILLLFAFSRTEAQFKRCDKVLLLGDTTVCQDLNRKGQIVTEDFYLQGKRIFTRRWTYYASGSYEFAQTLSKGPHAKKNGPATYYYPDGQVQWSSFYRHGTKIGPCVSYYPTGIVQHTCQRHVLGEKWDGLVNDYHPNGNIATKRLWDNGRLHTILAYKDKDGHNLPIGTFKDGNGDVYYYVEGKPVWIYTYRKGKLIRSKMVFRADEKE